MDKTLPRLAVLYADVCGSTRLYEEHGDAIARGDIAQCLSVLSQAAASLDGETLKTIGDEVMCAFADPVKGALAATEMQAALRKAGEADRFKMGILRIKIGWHYGNVIWHEEELLGEAPVTAQQLIRLAKPDEILTSQQSIDALPPAMFPNVHLIDHIPAESWDGQLAVYKMPWRLTGEETEISERAPLQEQDLRGRLQLSYGGRKLIVDASRPHCSIGRAEDVDLQVDGKFTSRLHAEIVFRHGRFIVRDESVNGTVIVGADGNHKRLHREEDILSGTGRLGFGATPAEDPQAIVDFHCL